MALNFEPRPVPPNRSFAWVKDGLDLVTRRWFTFTLLILVPALLLRLVDNRVKLIASPLLAALLVSTSIVIAACTDERKPVLPALRAAKGAYLRLLGIVAFKQGLTMLLLGLGAHFISEIALTTVGMAPALSDFGGGSWLLYGLTCGWVMSYPDSEFFLLPLLFRTGAGYFDAKRASASAGKVNSFTNFRIQLPMVMVCTLLCGLLGFGAILMLPLTGAMLYAAYRDVFLGKAENAPAPAKSASLAITATATTAPN